MVYIPVSFYNRYDDRLVFRFHFFSCMLLSFFSLILSVASHFYVSLVFWCARLVRYNKYRNIWKWVFFRLVYMFWYIFWEPADDAPHILCGLGQTLTHLSVLRNSTSRLHLPLKGDLQHVLCVASIECYRTDKDKKKSLRKFVKRNLTICECQCEAEIMNSRNWLWESLAKNP